ncbi:MAG TPA: alpha-L-fucosidase [Roseiflexaceae bacterium]|nr:alpha-L-fucosidase [Roseiflexaceae bacterium]
MTFEPTLESVRQHEVPAWFHDAKLGIFIHWGLYSVPAWAPTTGPLHDVVARDGWQGWFRRNPYAEWYMNSMRVEGGATAQFHAETYGADYPYARFAEEFNAAADQWDPADWAALFADAGAQYVVLTTKHHDGFLLWPSDQPNPYITGYHAARDLVGDLTDAVRATGLRMGLYYSGGLDWTFNPHVIQDISDLFVAVPQTEAYAEYATNHFRELIARYAPAVLWNDIGYPVATDLPALFAHYYNTITEGVINDRFIQVDLSKLSAPPDVIGDGEATPLPRPAHADFRTPEYAVYDEIKEEKWESCRGLGFSFGFNRNEDDRSMLSSDELIQSFVDIVSKNGNLLINVGPDGSGRIPEAQRERLLALGAWLRRNGAAIYGTRPWVRAEGRCSDGTAVRFTRGPAALYAMLLGTPTGSVTIEGVTTHPPETVELLGHGPLAWRQEGGDLIIELPADLAPAAAHAIAVTPVPAV